MRAALASHHSPFYSGLVFAPIGIDLTLHTHAALSSWLGATLLGGLGAGFSLEWMRGHGLPDYRKTSFGLALGSRNLSLGMGYHNLSSRDADLNRLYGFDLGLTLRIAFGKCRCLRLDLHGQSQFALSPAPPLTTWFSAL